jgi:hypothetical protein
LKDILLILLIVTPVSGTLITIWGLWKAWPTIDAPASVKLLASMIVFMGFALVYWGPFLLAWIKENDDAN